MTKFLEAKLLLSNTVLVAAAAVFFCLQGKLDLVTAGWAAAGLSGGYWVAYLVKNWRWPGTEPFLLPLAAWMNVLGLIFLYQLEPTLASKQWLWVLAGLSAMILLSLMPSYLTLVEYKYLGAGLALLLLIATLLVGVRAGGARSWLELGFIGFQPVEVVKLLMVIFLASYLDEQAELLKVAWRQWGPLGLPAPQALIPLLLMWGLSLLLVASQRDLGGALLLFLTLILMLYLSTGRALYLAAGGILLTLGFTTGFLLFGYVRDRVAAWLDPWQAVHGVGYQVIQGLFSLAAGGLIGTGLGLGHAGLVPAVASDYLFVAMAEEMGLAGALGLLTLYLLFVWRGFRISLKAPDSVGYLLAGGLTVLFALQSLLIIGGVTKLLPLTGVTLPLFSYGGSSMVVSYLLLGQLLQVSSSSSSSRSATGQAVEA